MRVIKIGGNELSDPGFVTGLAQSVADLRAAGEELVILHGGGRDIAGMQTRLGLEPIKVDGLRVTDLESLQVAQMVLSGHTNKLIVKALLAEEVDALGISGIDGGMLRCRKRSHPKVDLGYVGEVVEVRTGRLHELTQLGFTVVLSPISLGLDGLTYNVNADEAASAVALAVGAAQLDLVSNVPGVLSGREILPSLTPRQTEQLIAGGVVSGGMIPKVRAAVDAIQCGVAQARIVNLAGLAAGGGTVFKHE
jgi:acetylglutamate kinase